MFKQIVVALDGSEWGEAILPSVQALSEGTGAQLTLARVLKEAIATYPLEPAIVGLLATEVEQEHLQAAATARHDAAEQARAQAMGYLERVAQGLRRGTPIRCEVFTGDAAETVLDLARVIGADLITLSTHWREDAGKDALGAVAEEIVRRSEIATLLIRPTYMHRR